MTNFKKQSRSLLLFLILATPSVLCAQAGVKSGEMAAAPKLVMEKESAMSQGSKNGLSINLPKSNVKIAEQVWKEFTKSYKGSYKRDKKNDEYFTDNATVGTIGGANTVDLYMKFTEGNDNTTATLWIDLGGAYVSSQEFKDKYDATEKMLAEYALAVARKQTTMQLEEQTNMQKDLEKQQRRLEDRNKDLVKDIEDWKKKILKAEQDIQTNLKSQEETKAKIEAQKKVVDDVQKKLQSLN